MKSLDGDRSRIAQWVLGILFVLLIVTLYASLSIGASEVTADVLLKDLLGQGDTLSRRDRVVVYNIRAPRMVLGALVGAALAVSGAIMQGLFRNPLADPGIVGVTAGASLGAVLVIVLGEGLLLSWTRLLGMFSLPSAAFLGALLFTLALYRVATRSGRTSIATMLLAGLALAALAMALTGLLVFTADDLQLRELTFWQLGSLAGSTWTKVASASPVISVALASALFAAKGLNRLALGEAAALHMGVPVQRLKAACIVLIAAATGAAVAVSGGIGFVGIVVPHALRLAIGPDHRYLLPASALLGAAMLLVADTISRVIVAPAELPIGIITACIGAPFFLWVLLRRRGWLDL
ncbi:MAG: iron ABC transporter permease [Myxococcota bacterium]